MSQQEDRYQRRRKWCELPRGARIALMVLAGVVLVPAFFALFGAVTMWLWNWLMPAIFKLPVIGFWQAIGLVILSHILFKGNKFGKSGKRQWKKEKIRERMGEERPDATAG